MKRFAMLVAVLSTLALSACGGSSVKDNKYTAECKKIGNVGSEVQSCAKEMRKMEKEFSNLKEPTTEDTEKDLGLEPGSLSSYTEKEKGR